MTAINRKIEQYYISEEYKFRVAREIRESERKKIEAEGISEFQRIVSQGISDSYLRWRGIEATLQLAQSSNSKIVIVGSGKDGLPIILGNVRLTSPSQPAASGASAATGPRREQRRQLRRRPRSSSRLIPCRNLRKKHNQNPANQRKKHRRHLPNRRKKRHLRPPSRRRPRERIPPRSVGPKSRRCSPAWPLPCIPHRQRERHPRRRPRRRKPRKPRPKANAPARNSPIHRNPDDPHAAPWETTSQCRT